MIQTVPRKDEKFSDFLLPEDYIRYSPVTAEIRGFQDSRLIVFDRRWFQAADAMIRGRFPQKADAIWTKTGLQWGRHTYALLEQLAQTVFPSLNQIQDLAMEEFQTLFTNHIAVMGWGNFELKRRDNFLFVDLYDSLIADYRKEEAAQKKPVNHTVCHLYAGFFAGIFSSLSNMELACLEITCQASGYEHCSFLLDNPETVGMVEHRVQAGLLPLDAFEKIKKEIAE